VATCSSRASKIMGRLPRLLRSWWGRQGFCKELCYYWATSKVCRRLESSRWGYDFCCTTPRYPVGINFSHYINLLLLVKFLFHTFLHNSNNMIVALQESGEPLLGRMLSVYKGDFLSHQRCNFHCCFYFFTQSRTCNNTKKLSLIYRYIDTI
jgi:hypothetical protein